MCTPTHSTGNGRYRVVRGFSRLTIATALMGPCLPLQRSLGQEQEPPCFEAARLYAAGSYQWGLAVGDINEDGWTDVAVTQQGGVRVFLNTGNWEPGQGLDHSQDLSGVGGSQIRMGEAEFADLDRDGDLDLVAARNGDWHVPPGYVFVWLNDGEGSERFPEEPTDPYELTRAVLGLVAADLDADNYPDVALAATNTNLVHEADKVLVLWNNRQGIFDRIDEIDLGLDDPNCAHDLVVGQFVPTMTFGVSELDLVAANTNHDSVSLLENLGQRQFRAHNIEKPLCCATPDWRFRTITTGNYDGGTTFDDFATSYGVPSAKYAAVFKADGSGGFDHDCTRCRADDYWVSTCEADIQGSDSGRLNLGTWVDLVFSIGVGDKVGVLLGNGDGTFQGDMSDPCIYPLAYRYSVDNESPIGRTPRGVRIVDLNKDGLGDVITANQSGGQMSVLIQVAIESP